MDGTITNGQTCLEKRGMEERGIEITYNQYNYNLEKQYSATHKNAISDGDPQGKGAEHGGHTDWRPNCTENSNRIEYKNFATSEDGGHTIGGLYDREGRAGIPGRLAQMKRSLYQNGEGHEYGMKLIDTTANQEQGQYVFGDQIGLKQYK